MAFAAVRTPQNTTLVSSLDQITEFDSTGKTIWECASKDVAGAAIHNMTGIHALPNGHIVIGCYRAYSHGEGCGLLEISRDKKLIWRYSHPQGDGTMMPVELLSPEGRALSEPCLR